MKISIFDKEINIRDYYCQSAKKPIKEIDLPYINLYIRYRGCNANCDFCEYINSASYEFDLDKLKDIIPIIKEKLVINKINFTGGEPTLNYDRFLETFKIVSTLTPHSQTVINTNGINLHRLSEDVKTATWISISRHHYDDKKNNEIFKSEQIGIEDIKKLNTGNINFTCNLIKGYIDNREDFYKYLDHAHYAGIKMVGAVSLMPINDYCKSNFINLKDLNVIGDRLFLSKMKRYKESCICRNYVYFPNDEEFISIYNKNTYNPDGMYDVITFDGKYLRRGFSGEILY